MVNMGESDGAMDRASKDKTSMIYVKVSAQ